MQPVVMAPKTLENNSIASYSRLRKWLGTMWPFHVWEQTTLAEGALHHVGMQNAGRMGYKHVTIEADWQVLNVWNTVSSFYKHVPGPAAQMPINREESSLEEALRAQPIYMQKT